MKPGRELDTLVAEKVMENHWCQLMPENACIDGKPRKCACGAVGFPFEHRKPYSTDIAAAWEVVEKLNVSGYRMEFVLGSQGDAYATFITGACRFRAVSGSAPKAICLAALKAVGGEG